MSPDMTPVPQEDHITILLQHCSGFCVKQISAFPFHCPANKRLSELAMELTKAQETARRFQELLASERRKQTGLRVRRIRTMQVIT